MKRIWGYTLFWFAMGMLLMYIIGGGCIGILLIAGSLLLSYLLFSCRCGIEIWTLLVITGARSYANV